MGDSIRLKEIEFLYGFLFQIDIVNETKNEEYRVFCEIDKFFELLAKGAKRPQTIPDPNCGTNCMAVSADGN